MILIGIGANLPAPGYATPLATCRAAVARLAALGPGRCSPWYRSAPVPASDQPWFINGVLRLDTGPPPETCLARLHAVETAFGRVRTHRNAARVLDLDLLVHGESQRTHAPPLLPHPRLHERAFVLHPLRDVAPHWRHPTLKQDLETLIAALPPEQVVERVPVDLE